jgi:predicted esterase
VLSWDYDRQSRTSVRGATAGRTRTPHSFAGAQRAAQLPRQRHHAAAIAVQRTSGAAGAARAALERLDVWTPIEGLGTVLPNDELFFEGGARIFPDFLKMILADYKVQDGKFHIAGVSNGGISALHIAAANPQYFLSATAFPGYLWEATPAKLQAISKMCVFMYVGEFDPYMWHGEMKKEAEFLRSKGTVARYSVEQGQPHRIETLAGANAGRLFEGFEETAKGCSK